MENAPNFRRIEEIDRLLEDFATREGIDPDDALSDLLTFWKISQEDEDARAYLEAMAEELGVSIEEVIHYAIKKGGELEME